MADEQLRDYVLHRADEDTGLSEEARLAVLAAFGDPGDLDEVLSAEATPQRVIDALNTPDASDAIPVGAYLTSIAVQGFRGVGASVTVPLQPGPGLVVIAGRNGSGKSTLAEGLELALTGINSRWENKSAVWSQAWRNLHAGDPARIRPGLAEQGSGATVLGVEALTVATSRLDVEVKAIKEPAGVARKARDALRVRLETHDDPRAATALAVLAKTKPGLELIRPLITEGAAASAPAAWRQAWGLTTPAVEEVGQACATLRAAAAEQAGAERTADALATDRVQLLETGLLFHERHGSQPCPVCLTGTLDDDWAQRARLALAKELDAAQILRAAHSNSHRARQALTSVARTVQSPPAEDAGLATIAAARRAYEAFSVLPSDDDVALADHVETMLLEVQAAYAELRQEASGLISARDDAWGPLAVDLADWCKKYEASAVVAPRCTIATEAQKWLQENAAMLRNERIAPLADKAREIWAALRQESNVDLARIELLGHKTSRRVLLKAGVDGADTDALGVMSQGELQALALAIFIPRATSGESPFRFVVLDDPIQAMDPSKIEGFLQVLVTLAAGRQVVVFTHDDRLLQPSGDRVRALASSRSPVV